MNFDPANKDTEYSTSWDKFTSELDHLAEAKRWHHYYMSKHANLAQSNMHSTPNHVQRSLHHAGLFNIIKQDYCRTTPNIDYMPIEYKTKRISRVMEARYLNDPKRGSKSAIHVFPKSQYINITTRMHNKGPQ